MQLSKPHTFMFLFHYHLVPTKPIDSFSLWIRVPPKRIHHLLQFIFKSGRKQIDTHVISGYRLSNRFYKNLYTCFWELFCCPMANVILDFVLYKIEDHFFLFSMIDGSPKYLVEPIVCMTPRKEGILSLCCWWVLKLKKFSDFWKLIIWPETSPYLSIISFRMMIFLSSVLQNKKQLLTNKRCKTRGAPFHTFTPMNLHHSPPYMRRVESPYFHKMKR